MSFGPYTQACALLSVVGIFLLLSTVGVCRHFGWLHDRLLELGSSYGALPVHDLIFRAAASTRVQLIERLAIGQLVQEARGLDAAPRVAERLNSWVDRKSSEIVSQIGEEEVDHVRMGMKWYLYLCDKSNIEDPVAHFHKIALERGNYGAFSPPFNQAQRQRAGLAPDWYLPVSKTITEILQRRKLENRSRP